MEYLLLFFWLVGTAAATVWMSGLGQFNPVTSIRLRSPNGTGVRRAYAGFSKSYLIFGGLVPITRGEVFIGLLHLFCTAISFGVFQGVTCFVYNKQHLGRLIASGWQVESESGDNPDSIDLKSSPDGSESTNQSQGTPYTSDMPMIGQIQLFAFNYMPIGWTLCDGRLLPLQEHMVVFALLGTTHGGDGVSTFAVPNLLGKEPVPGTVYGICTGGGHYPSRPLA